MKVRATKICAIDGHRRRKGAVFDIDPKHFSKNCMEKLADDAPEAESRTDWAAQSVANLKEELGRRGVPFPSSATKPVLVAMLEAADGGARPAEARPAEAASDEGEGEDLT